MSSPPLHGIGTGAFPRQLASDHGRALLGWSFIAGTTSVEALPYPSGPELEGLDDRAPCADLLPLAPSLILEG